MFSESAVSHVTTEQIDDIPLILSIIKELNLADIFDNQYSPHKNHQGLSYGWLACIWLSHILSESKHTLNSVEPWSQSIQSTLSQLIGFPIREKDFTDDRLQDLLKRLSEDESWEKIESQLTTQTIRVYDLGQAAIRLDATTVAADYDSDYSAILKMGRHKDGSFKTVFKMMLASLDPMGMPIASDIVPGNREDGPLYIPIYQRVSQMISRSRQLYVGDCKMSALETRATIVHNEDYYLAPFPMIEANRQFLNEKIKQIHAKTLELIPVYIPGFQPTSDGVENDQNTIAWVHEGTRTQEKTLNDETVQWKERYLVARSKDYTEQEIRIFESKLDKAQKQVKALNPEKASKRKRYFELKELEEKAQSILKRFGFEAFFQLQYESLPEKPEKLVVKITRESYQIRQHKKTLGWKLYGTNAPKESLSAPKAILCYRQEYRIERNFNRFKGYLEIHPLYLSIEDHIIGLVRLLTLALRVMTLIEFRLRARLQQQNRALEGLYDGNPSRKTTTPTTEKILTAFSRIYLTIITLTNGQQIRHLTPLNSTQEQILKLLALDENIYTHLQSFRPSQMSLPLNWADDVA